MSQQQLSGHSLQDSTNTIAQLLGIDKKLAALARITLGSIAEADFTGSFILVSHDEEFVQQASLTNQITLK